MGKIPFKAAEVAIKIHYSVGICSEAWHYPFEDFARGLRNKEI